MSLVHNIVSCFSIFFFITEDEGVTEQQRVIFDQVHSQAFMWCLWVSVVFNILMGGFLGHLIVYHINLKRMGLTTYEYIRLKEKRTKESKIVIRKNIAQVQNLPT
jgi:hypothetical protein